MTASSFPPPESAAVARAANAFARRRWLLGGVGAAALAGGAGLAWWHRLPHDAVAGGEAGQVLWDSTFSNPAGAPMAMAGFRGKPLLLNFWATWCPPCVEELPLLNTFFKAQADKGWQVVGLAIDQPSAVRKFLDRLPLDFPVVLGGLAGTDLSRALGNLSGGLPFSVLFGADGRILHRKMGRLTADDLAQWAQLA